ncbi:17742_t:CDS:2 [Funneliformis geosporum]|uniref:17742_t:CDS:1 n=1 Tax=Funneliformis geosporum TaxID=1117311 RepID=A0A9W4SMM8_9GLOM|nr:17742_t:CDS:2 [Funneliformis geosporum]
MSGDKVNIMTILDPQIEINNLSFVSLVNTDDDRLIQIFDTLIQCLDPFDKKCLSKRSIEIDDLSTPRAYFNYHTFIREFELNPLQKAMRLWTSIHFSNIDGLPRNGRSRVSNGGRRVSKRVISINNGPRSILNICEFKNHKQSLVNVRKLSIGLFNNNGTDLMTPVAELVLKLQDVLSPNVQHFQILSINSIKPKFSRNLINFIQSQDHLKSLLLSHDFWKDEFEPFRIALRKHSNSLTFFKLECSILFTSKLLSILKSLPKLITLDLKFMLSPDGDVSRDISTITFNRLEHLNYEGYSSHNSNPITLFKTIILSAKNLKSLKIDDSDCLYIKEIQGLCFSNLTHFHLVIFRSELIYSISLEDLLELLRNLHQLIHLKLNTKVIRRNLSDRNLFQGFSKVLACSLKIFEFNFPVSDKSLEILFNESKFNLECLKLYRLEHYLDISLKIFIDYAKRKGSFKELGITREFTFSKERIKQAQNYFKITVHSDNEIWSPFYDIPIKNSYWSNRR